MTYVPRALRSKSGSGYTPVGLRKSRPGSRTTGTKAERDFVRKYGKERGGIGGFMDNIGEGLRTAAVGSAIGTVELGRAVGKDLATAARGEYRPERGAIWRDVAKPIGQDFGRRYGNFTWNDLYEDPVPFVIDALTVASLGAGSVARVGAAGKAVRAGQGAKGVGRALRHGPETELRYARSPDADTEVLLGAYSRSALARRTQKFLDGIRQRFPNAPILGRSLYRKIGFQQERLAQIDERIARIGAEELLSVAGGRKLSAAQHRALRIQAEGVPLDKRIARHRSDLAKATDARQARRLRGEIRLLEKTRKYLDDDGLTLRDPKLRDVYQLARASTKRREDLLASFDELAPAAAAARVQKPGRFFGDDAAKGDAFFTYSSKKRPTTFARLGAARTIRHPRSPGTKQEFTGEAITQGRIPRGEAMLAAEAELEAWRFTTVLRNRDRLIAQSKPQPTRGSDVAIVLDDLKGKRLPEEVQAFLGKVSRGELLVEEETTALARLSDGLRESIFPGNWDDLKAHPVFGEALERPVPGVVWIDHRLLGGIHSANPLVVFSGNLAGKATLGAVDLINNAQRAAILYLLPFKYITPNLISQTAFALIQQGFAAPRNLTAAARLNAKLGRKAQLAIDAGMGEGFAASIAGETGGRLARFNRAAARFYGAVIDVPFRRAAFLHEAKRAGHATPAEVRKLLFDDSLRDKRNAVFMEANGEIIDYARLGRYERSLVRRLIFFYPWVKGATVYGARMLVEHPGKVWALDQLGKVGTERQAEVLGELLPSYADALAPVGESGGLPTTLNLAAVSPFTTPYQSIRAATGDTRAGYSIGSQFSPALNALIMGAGFTPPGGYKAGPGEALRELYEGLPQYRYPRRIIEGTKPSYVYPTTPQQDLFSLLFGSVTPRRTNPKRLRDEAKRGR